MHINYPLCTNQRNWILNMRDCHKDRHCHQSYSLFQCMAGRHSNHQEKRSHCVCGWLHAVDSGNICRSQHRSNPTKCDSACLEMGSMFWSNIRGRENFVHSFHSYSNPSQRQPPAVPLLIEGSAIAPLREVKILGVIL